MLIRIGLAGWGDHDVLYHPGTKANEKLSEYAKYFPVVEVDATFYAIPSEETCRRWVEMTPDHFSFIVKAFQGLTGHSRVPTTEAEKPTLMKRFLEAIAPFSSGGKLKAVLFQFPPWFDCTRPNVQLLREIKQQLGDTPAALEFRHQSWFADGWKEQTLQFMTSEGWIHSICDEPQVAPQSVPTVLKATTPDVTIVRMHGRNASGWNNKGNPDWRAVRYLYKYGIDELQEWADRLRLLEKETNEICVVFNNNSGGDAAGNARELMNLVGQTCRAFPQPPEQLELFE